MDAVSVPDDATERLPRTTAHAAFALNLRRDETRVAACFGFVRESGFAHIEKCAVHRLSPARSTDRSPAGHP